MPRPESPSAESPRIEPAAGDGYDLLVSAVAVADRDWCSVLRHGPSLRGAVQAAGGAGLVADAARFGRFGWINLLGLLGRRPGTGTRRRLLGSIAALPDDELHFVLAGGRRVQLTAQLPAARLRAALSGEADALGELRRALRSPRVLLDVTRWLQTTSSSEVKAVLLRTIEAWPEVGRAEIGGPVKGEPARRTGRSSAALRSGELDGAALLRRVTPGIRYGPDVLDRVLLVSSPLVEPIIISVDQTDVTVLVHPPDHPDGMADSATLLGTQGAAVGDQQRVAILQSLRTGPRTLAELGASTGRPRTTLLHHLALLRAAGFVTLVVTAGEPNIYRLDPGGFDSLARAARGFVLD